jgi:hypothetical protein
MIINKEDRNTLDELCREYGVELDKILKLLSTVQEYELKDKRFGIYEALEEIIKQKEGITNGKE